MPKIILMLMFASSLFASHAGEIYTYGYFEFVRDNLLVHITVYPDTSVGLNRTVEEEIFSVAIF